jgi:hypothetical protein
MEIHPPHHTISTWRDFFVHMGTICLGLLIAIGLEQSVEAFHRAQERHELREALDRDSREAIVDAGRSETYADARIAWILARIKEVQAALASHATLAPENPLHTGGFDVAEDPAFQAAKSSGALALLSQEDIRAYSEADWVNVYLLKAYDEYVAAHTNMRKFNIELGPLGRAADFSKADPAALHDYLGLLTDELMAAMTFRFWSQEVQGIEAALIQGERNLAKLQRAERSLHTPIAALGTN